MKTLAGKKGFGTFAVVALIAGMMFILPEAAHAQNLGNILKSPNFLPIIKFGIGLYAAWKWFEYFSNFSPNSAFKDIIVPALMTFLAFQIDKVLGWFQLNSL